MTNNENGENTTKEKFYHVDVSFTDEAFVRCSADNEETAQERAIAYVSGQGMKDVKVVAVKEVETLIPEDMEGHVDTLPETENKTIN